MRFVEKIRYIREFNKLRRDIQASNPTWSQEEVIAEAMEQMKAKFGADTNWLEIIKVIMELIMKILPFFMLAEET